MSLLNSKVSVLAVASLVTGAMTMLAAQWPSKSAEPVAPVSYEAKAETIPDLITLRIAAKYRIARDVVAGDFSLYQGAALFGALNQVSPRSPDLALMPVSEDSLGRSELGQLCTQVILYVRWHLAEDPEQAAAAVARLKADFEENLRDKASFPLTSPWTLVSVQDLLAQARAELTEKGVISPRKG